MPRPEKSVRRKVIVWSLDVTALRTLPLRGCLAGQDKYFLRRAF
jgi:hypothetical protein